MLSVFVRSGHIGLDFDALKDSGATYVYWSETAEKASSAYALRGSPSSDNQRQRGFSLRCLQE